MRFRAGLSNDDVDDILAIRYDFAGTEASGFLVARKRIPGLIASVKGGTQSLRLGAAELTFRKMMIGYVDRMGGLRGLSWMLISLAPLLVMSVIIAPGDVNFVVRLLVLGVVALGSIGTFSYVYPYLKYSQPLKLCVQLQKTSLFKGAYVRGASWLNRPYIKPIIGALGAIALGIIGNKLSDAIPFP